jgi:hypothetical protein
MASAGTLSAAKVAGSESGSLSPANAGPEPAPARLSVQPVEISASGTRAAALRRRVDLSAAAALFGMAFKSLRRRAPGW